VSCRGHRNVQAALTKDEIGGIGDVALAANNIAVDSKTADGRKALPVVCGALSAITRAAVLSLSRQLEPILKGVRA
jgi:hypothetical protein